MIGRGQGDNAWDDRGWAMIPGPDQSGAFVLLPVKVAASAGGAPLEATADAGVRWNWIPQFF